MVSMKAFPFSAMDPTRVLAEQTGKAFHFADLVNHHDHLIVCGDHQGHGSRIDVLQVDPVSSHPFGTPDIDVRQYPALAVQGCYGKSKAPAPIPNFPCKEPAARPVESLNDFLLRQLDLV